MVEEPARRLASMDGIGIERQILSTWMDISGAELRRIADDNPRRLFRL